MLLAFCLISLVCMAATAQVTATGDCGDFGSMSRNDLVCTGDIKVTGRLNLSYRNYSITGNLEVAGALTMSTPRLELRTDSAGGKGMLIVDSGATLTMETQSDGEAIIASSVIVVRGGSLSARNYGQRDSTWAPVQYCSICGGGGHAKAGDPGFQNALPGKASDNPYQPMLAGGWGGASKEQYGSGVGGLGGGNLKFICKTLRLEGTLSANGDPGTCASVIGQSGSCFYVGGGGAGGSLWIVADSLQGKGILSATGGQGATNEAGAGSGGMVAVYAGHLPQVPDIRVVTPNKWELAGTVVVNGDSTIPYAEAYTLRLQSPLGGERVALGSVQPITWQSQGLQSEAVGLEYGWGDSTDISPKYWNWIAPATPNTGTYAWKVPDAPFERVWIRITGHYNTLMDQSDSSFAIVDPMARILHPALIAGGKVFSVQGRPIFALQFLSAVEIYDRAGRLVDRVESEGTRFDWDGRDGGGGKVGAGLFLARPILAGSIFPATRGIGFLVLR